MVFLSVGNGDWDLECGGPCDPDCCQSQIRLVLSSYGFIGLDYRWAWDWYQSSLLLFSTIICRSMGSVRLKIISSPWLDCWVEIRISRIKKK